MDIKGLQYFIAAAERLNFTVAARECFITQTAMSLHISKMEDELGFPLFYRSKRFVELTKAGKYFYKDMKKIVQIYEAAVEHGANVAQGTNGIIRILLPSCIEGFLFLDKFRLFNKLYHDVDLRVMIDTPERHIDSVKNGQADICIGAPDDMECESEFVVERVRNDPAVLICKENHPFAKMGIVDAEQLKSECIICCGPHGIPNTFRITLKHRLKLNIDTHSILSVNNLDEMLLMIELGRGIGILPEFIKSRIPFDTTGLTFIPYTCGTETPAFVIAMGYLKDNTNPVVPLFTDFFLQQAVPKVRSL
jgi:DNA-binding transcriptional LysR family regulator